MSTPTAAWIWIAATTAWLLITSIDAPYPEQFRLQHVPTVLTLIGLCWLARRGMASKTALACIHLFLWLHIFGARWSYSNVPYDAWSQSLFGVSLSQQFGWTRNHYDRLVHLASGVLLTPAAYDWLRWRRVGWTDAALLAVTIVLAIGAAYEILEWGLAVVLAPAQAEAYNGQQGDAWDPQKDMALALLGASLSAVALIFAQRRLADRVS